MDAMCIARGNRGTTAVLGNRPKRFVPPLPLRWGERRGEGFVGPFWRMEVKLSFNYLDKDGKLIGTVAVSPKDFGPSPSCRPFNIQRQQILLTPNWKNIASRAIFW